MTIEALFRKIRKAIVVVYPSRYIGYDCLWRDVKRGEVVAVHPVSGVFVRKDIKGSG